MPAGAVTVIEVALLTVIGVADAVPNCTAVTPVKLVPVMVTDVPPAGGPELGLTDADGGGAGDDVGELVSGARGARAPRGGDRDVHGPASRPGRWR